MNPAVLVHAQAPLRMLVGMVAACVVASCGASSVVADGPLADGDADATGSGNTYHGIAVDVVGLPYAYKDIRGNRMLDDLMAKVHRMMTSGTLASMIHFRINQFVLTFGQDGGLVISTVYSHDQTPAHNGGHYPAAVGDVHDWRLQPSYHLHGGGPCSLDLYRDVAVAQAQLNQLRRDPSLGKVYDIVASVAEDMDYDFNAIGVPARLVTLANGQQPMTGVCSGYADVLVQRLEAAQIAGVSEIRTVSGQNHAWVTLRYQGRVLYIDATWFDGNNIDANGVVDHVPYKDPRYFTFDEDIFTNHGQHHLADPL